VRFSSNHVLDGIAMVDDRILADVPCVSVFRITYVDNTNATMHFGYQLTIDLKRRLTAEVVAEWYARKRRGVCCICVLCGVGDLILLRLLGIVRSTPP
jgi:hypothetical protein